MFDSTGHIRPLQVKRDAHWRSILYFPAKIPLHSPPLPLQVCIDLYREIGGHRQAGHTLTLLLGPWRHEVLGFSSCQGVAGCRYLPFDLSDIILLAIVKTSLCLVEHVIA